MFLLYLLIGIIAGIFGAKIAKKKGRDSTLWVIICFLFPKALIGLDFLPKKW